MTFNHIHISDLFNTVVQRMRPAGTITLITSLGSGIYRITSSTEVVSTKGLFSLRNDDYVDLLNSSGTLILSYKTLSVAQYSFTIHKTGAAPVGITWRSQAPYYEHGHILEVSNTLQQKNQDQTLKFQKYPLVVLIQDIKENNGKYTHDYSIPNINLFIAALTDPNYKAEKRKTDNFELILYPLYKRLLNEIHYSRLFSTWFPDKIEHSKIDRYYWGKEGEFANTKNIFGDWLDAIEINNMNLKVKPKSNLIKNQIF